MALLERLLRKDTLCPLGSFLMSVSLSASVPFSGFASVRFWRSRRPGSGAVFVLSGVPAACAGAWGFRLFVLGYSLIELGQQASGRVWFGMVWV